MLVQAKTATSDLTAPQLNCASIAAITEGYLPADLRDLVDRAVQQAAIRSLLSSSAAAPSSNGLVLTADDFHAAQQGFVPLSLRDVKLQKSDVAWADIGGLHDARKTLRETLEWPTKYGAIFASCPLRLRSGCVATSPRGSVTRAACLLAAVADAVKVPHAVSSCTATRAAARRCSPRPSRKSAASTLSASRAPRSSTSTLARRKRACATCLSALRRQSPACFSLTSLTRSHPSGALLDP